MGYGYDELVRRAPKKGQHRLIRAIPHLAVRLAAAAPQLLAVSDQPVGVLLREGHLDLLERQT